jgi:hypothetical protein
MSPRFAVVIGTLLVAGCTSESSHPTAPLAVPVYSQSSSAAPVTAGGASLSASRSANANGGNFGTPLSAAEEVPARDSNARGSAVFQLSEDGTELSYQLIVANIENVFQAHIHSGVAGANGPIVTWLYPSTAASPGPLGAGRIDGVIAKGTITAANLVGGLAGQPLSALVSLLTSGGAYVNVHTNDGVAPTNTGAGDFPGGEIRGQVEHRGH